MISGRAWPRLPSEFWCEAPALTFLCVDCRLRTLLLCLMLCRQARHPSFSVSVNLIHMRYPFAVSASVMKLLP